MNDLKEAIIDLAKTLNIQKIGFTTADNFEYLRKSLVEQKEAGHTSGFEHQNLDERLHPKLAVADAKTIISIAIAYPNKTLSKPEKTEFRRGQFSRGSWGEDYHAVLQRKLNALALGIEKLAGQFHYQAMVDTGALVDVAVAARAGIGFIGKNGLLISKEYGSWMFLGELVTTLEIEPDSAVDYGCGTCTRCVDFCPTTALLGDGRLNAQKCLSYQTQAKGKMPLEYREKIKTVIYGCDICQMVCPYNKGIDSHFHPEMEADAALTNPELLPLLDLSNKQFVNKFGKMAGAWRGKNPIQRNAVYALANANDKTALPKLKEMAKNDSRDVMVDAAKWAIEKLENGKTRIRPKTK
ncbi:tRNA epoxyqueuosine(34) reductase QueG [Lactococcus hircilactis]|uniref:tRNA epoxyqueuosine(34) reductase QueG n=1 Tax=Lactococcus hircilactis TaxID=1494462 RepID=A0A7X1Z708_9LACT|nr:tRNA epoxyqueuosine(34) reductase QueG [Lactococcus hircilactis]MQW38885.1 tRNA epoxyqueuosine(34) reductase QueG [Lactococcus hircilactis]